MGSIDDLEELYEGSVGSSLENRSSGNAKGRIVTRLKNGLFGVLFTTVKDSTVPAFVAIAEILVDAFQVLAFPFSHRFHFPWNSAATEWFIKLCSIFVPEVYIAGSEGWFLAGLALVVLMLADVVFVAYSFSRKSYKMMWTIKLLRTFGGLFATVLFIPLLGVLTGVLSCDHVTSCGQGIDLMYKILSVGVSALFIFLALCTSAAFFDQDPKGHDSLARPHARIDVFYVLVRTVLTVMHNALPVNSAGKWAFAATMTVGSLSSAFLHTWYIPYYRFGYSMLRNATQWLLASACLCLLLAMARNSPDQSEASILFFLSSPVVVALSVFTISSRRRSLAVKTIRQCRDPYEVELRIRFALEKEGMLFATEDEFHDTEPDEAALAAQAINLRAINAMYAEAVKRRPKSSLLHIFWANYYLLYLKNSNMALAELANAEELKPSLDEQFLIYRWQALLSEAASQSSAHGGIDVIAYVQYQKHLADAEKFDRRVAASRAAFWTELNRPKPDLERLYDIGERISLNLARAIASYENLMKLAPESPQVLRMYASFLIDIMNEASQGEELLLRAKSIENTRSKQADDCDVAFDDSNATVTISGARGKEGTVIEVNMAACRLFGYRRFDIVGKNINIIIPAPIARNHNRILANYLASGYGSMMDRKRRIVCIHANGFIVPALIVIRQAIDAHGSTCFIGVLRPISSDEHYIVLDRNMAVIGCTASIPNLFGISHDDIKAGDINVHSLIAAYSAIEEAAIAAGKGSGARAPVVQQQCGQPGAQHNYTLTVTCVRMESCGEHIDIVSFSAVPEGANAASADAGPPLPQFSSDDYVQASASYIPEGGENDHVSTRPAKSSATPQSCPRRAGSAEAGAGKQCGLYLSADVAGADMPRGSGSDKVRSMSATLAGGLYGMVTEEEEPVRRGPVVGATDQRSSKGSVNAYTPPLMSVSSRRASVRFGSSIDVSQGATLPGIPLSDIALQEVDYNDQASDVMPDDKGDTEMPSLEFSNHKDGKKPAAQNKKKGGGSIASSTGTDSSMRQRSRNIIEDKNARTSPEALRLKYGTLLSAAIVIGLAIAAVIVLRKAAEDYTSTITCVSNGGARRLETITVIRDVRTLVLAANNLSVNVTAASLVSELSSSASLLKSHMAALFTGGQCLTAQLEELYIEKNVPVAMAGGATHMMSVWEGMQLFISKAMQIAARDPSMLSFTDDDVEFVIANGPYSLFTAIESSMSEYVGAVSDAADTLKKETVILAAVPLGCLVLIFLVIIFPALLRLERRKAELMDIFLAMPRRVVRDMMDKDRIRLESMLSRETDGDMGGPDTVVLDHVQDETVMADDMNHHRETEAPPASLAMDAPVGESRTSTRNRRPLSEPLTKRISRSVRAQRAVLLRLLVLLALCVGYYTALLVVGDNLVSDVSSSGIEVNLSDRRSALERLIFFHTRESVIAPSNSSALSHAGYVANYTREILDIDDELLYGSAALGLRASVRRSGIGSLMFSDACSYVSDVPSTYPSCTDFANGLMTNGLQPALFEFSSRARRMTADAVSVSRPLPFEVLRTAIRTAPDLMFVRMMDWAYLQGPLAQSTKYYMSYGSDKVDAFRNFVLAISLAAIFSVAALWLFVFRPMTARTEASIRNTRLMVLMVPQDDTTALAPRIRTFLKTW